MQVPESFKPLEQDAKDAAYRLAGRQFVKLTRDPIVAFLAGHLGPDDPSMRAKIGAFLDTELGEAMVATMLSLGLSALPKGIGEQAPLLAKELRVKAMTDVGDVVADLLMGPLRSVIADLIKGEAQPLPALPVESEHLVPMPSLNLTPQEEPVQLHPTKNTATK